MTSRRVEVIRGHVWEFNRLELHSSLVEVVFKIWQNNRIAATLRDFCI